MQGTAQSAAGGLQRTTLSSVLELMHPITWFAPMWAYGCGIVSSGVSVSGHWPQIFLGVLLAGPLVCGSSQIWNDWFDRDVDAINEPDRPIPSGRVPGNWGLILGCSWAALSLAVAASLGWWTFWAACFGLILAWIYSAPPLRLKMNGWYGNAAVGLCYEGLAWFTGAAVMMQALPDWRIILVAVLYSIGAHGIMTLNDFKAVEGDRVMGVRTLPVQIGSVPAAKLACVFMAFPQFIVLALLYAWGAADFANYLIPLIVLQLVMMIRFLANPRDHAPWYNATGTTLYTWGMLLTAFALSGLINGAAA